MSGEERRSYLAAAKARSMHVPEVLAVSSSYHAAERIQTIMGCAAGAHHFSPKTCAGRGLRAGVLPSSGVWIMKILGGDLGDSGFVLFFHQYAIPLESLLPVQERQISDEDLAAHLHLAKVDDPFEVDVVAEDDPMDVDGEEPRPVPRPAPHRSQFHINPLSSCVMPPKKWVRTYVGPHTDDIDLTYRKATCVINRKTGDGLTFQCTQSSDWEIVTVESANIWKEPAKSASRHLLKGAKWIDHVIKTDEDLFERGRAGGADSVAKSRALLSFRTLSDSVAFPEREMIEKQLKEKEIMHKGGCVYICRDWASTTWLLRVHRVAKSTTRAGRASKVASICGKIWPHTGSSRRAVIEAMRKELELELPDALSVSDQVKVSEVVSGYVKRNKDADKAEHTESTRAPDGGAETSSNESEAEQSNYGDSDSGLSDNFS